MPAAPLDSAHQITADVLDLTSSPITQAALRGHPGPPCAAVWCAGCLLAPAGAAALAGAGAASGLLPWWTVAAAALLTAACGAPLAWDAYRGLGHALHGDYLVVRQGAFVRRTVALRRERIVGWTGRQSYTQRRAGLCTLTATTAAGKGAVRIRDIGVAEGTRLRGGDAAGPPRPVLRHADRAAPLAPPDPLASQDQARTTSPLEDRVLRCVPEWRKEPCSKH